MPRTQPIPDGFHTITPYLVVREATAAIEFYKNAFNAREIMRSTCENSQRILNAKLRIGDSMIMLNDEFPECGCHAPSTGLPSSITIHLYVENVDEVFDQAVAAGAIVSMAPENTFWGDRFAQIKDPFGHKWSIATHVEDLSEEEVQERAKRAFP